MAFSLLFVFGKRFLFFGYFLWDGNFKVFHFVFVCFNFGFLERANGFVLLKFFLIESDIDFELFSFIDDLISLFFKFL